MSNSLTTTEALKFIGCSYNTTREEIKSALSKLEDKKFANDERVPSIISILNELPCFKHVCNNENESENHGTKQVANFRIGDMVWCDAYGYWPGVVVEYEGNGTFDIDYFALSLPGSVSDLENVVADPVAARKAIEDASEDNCFVNGLGEVESGPISSKKMLPYFESFGDVIQKSMSACTGVNPSALLFQQAVLSSIKYIKFKKLVPSGCFSDIADAEKESRFVRRIAKISAIFEQINMYVGAIAPIVLGEKPVSKSVKNLEAMKMKEERRRLELEELKLRKQLEKEAAAEERRLAKEVAIKERLLAKERAKEAERIEAASWPLERMVSILANGFTHANPLSRRSSIRAGTTIQTAIGIHSFRGTLAAPTTVASKKKNAAGKRKYSTIAMEHSKGEAGSGVCDAAGTVPEIININSIDVKKESDPPPIRSIPVIVHDIFEVIRTTGKCIDLVTVANNYKLMKRFFQLMLEYSEAGCCTDAGLTVEDILTYALEHTASLDVHKLIFGCCTPAVSTGIMFVWTQLTTLKTFLHYAVVHDRIEFMEFMIETYLSRPTQHHETYDISKNENNPNVELKSETPGTTIEDTPNSAVDAASVPNAHPQTAPIDRSTVIICDDCDAEYFVLDLGFTAIPAGEWYCAECAVKPRKFNDNYIQKLHEAELHVDCSSGNVTAKNYFVNYRDARGYTALHIAVEEGHFKAAKVLLRYGADVNAKNKRSRTPLHLACSAGEFNIVALLLQYDPHIDAKDCDHYTPLMWCAGQDTDTVTYGGALCGQLLVAAGAKLNYLDDGRNSAMFWAIRHKLPTLAKDILIASVKAIESVDEYCQSDFEAECYSDIYEVEESPEEKLVSVKSGWHDCSMYVYERYCMDMSFGLEPYPIVLDLRPGYEEVKGERGMGLDGSVANEDGEDGEPLSAMDACRKAHLTAEQYDFFKKFLASRQVCNLSRGGSRSRLDSPFDMEAAMVAGSTTASRYAESKEEQHVRRGAADPVKYCRDALSQFWASKGRISSQNTSGSDDSDDAFGSDDGSGGSLDLIPLKAVRTSGRLTAVTTASAVTGPVLCQDVSKYMKQAIRQNLSIIPKFVYSMDIVKYLNPDEYQTTLNARIGDVGSMRCCKCIGDCKMYSNCPCLLRNGQKYPYSDDSTFDFNVAKIYECGPGCACNTVGIEYTRKMRSKSGSRMKHRRTKDITSACALRLTQGGVSAPLVVCRASGKGLGVICLKSYPKGAFICTYTGEQISEEQLVKQENDKVKRLDSHKMNVENEFVPGSSSGGFVNYALQLNEGGEDYNIDSE